ncbi:MAG TPA: hypothetical protein VMB25_15445 [Bryobacteraceae bacterium]|nr:hypothetical protein [Bryobacteraceae bacterium]
MILDPPSYSAGAWIVFIAVCVGLVGLFLLFRGFLPAMGMLLLVSFGLGALGAYLMTSKRVITLSRADGTMKIASSAFGRNKLEATFPLDQIRKVVVENVHFTHSLVAVTKSGDSFPLGDGSNRQGYYGAADAINDFLGPG